MATYSYINDGFQLRIKNTNGSHRTFKPMDGTFKLIKTFQNELVRVQAPALTAIPHNLQPYRNVKGSAESDGIGDFV